MTIQEQTPLSTRNLVDAGLGPLRRLTGVLAGLPTEEKTYGEGDNIRKALRVTVNLKDIEVLEAVEPYHFPIFSVTLSHSTSKTSRWGVFGESFNRLADKQVYSDQQLDPSNAEFVQHKDRIDINDAIDHRVGLVMSDGVDGRPTPPMLYDGRPGIQKEVPTPCWQFYLLDGIGKAALAGAQETAMQLLDGKTIQQFNTEALINNSIREDAGILAAIGKPLSASDSFITTMINTGQFVVDSEGIYHRQQVEG